MKITFAACFVLSAMLATFSTVNGQCVESPSVHDITTGLREPLGTALSNQGNLIVSETGTSVPNSGRISIVTGPWVVSRIKVFSVTAMLASLWI